MIINSNSDSNWVTQVYESPGLSFVLKEKAKAIKNRSFKVTINDRPACADGNPGRYESFADMFSKITKRIKIQLKQQRRSMNKQATHSSVVIGKQVSLKKGYNYQSDLSRLNDHSRKVKTAISEPHFNYSQVEFKPRSSFNSKRRKTTMTNLNERIWKGSTVSRLTSDHNRSRPDIVSKVKTESEDQFVEEEVNFRPLGQIQFNDNSYRYLKDRKQSAQGCSYNNSEPEEEPLKQIYDKIFVKFPKPQQNSWRKTSRNMRKLYSSYKASHEARPEQRTKVPLKQVFVSEKNMSVNVPKLESEPSFRAENAIGPWAQQKLY